MPAKKRSTAGARKTTTPATRPPPKKTATRAATKTAAKSPPGKTTTGRRAPPSGSKTPPAATIPSGELPEVLATGFKSLRADLGRKTDKAMMAALKRLEEGYRRLLK